MNIKEAKELLSFHSSRNSDMQNPKRKNGFLGILRRFGGELHQENFIEVIECLKTLTNEFSTPTIDREIISDIVAVIHLTREWTSPDGGMLEVNHLLAEEQTKDLLTWIDIIESCFMMILDGCGEEYFEEYEDYINDV